MQHSHVLHEILSRLEIPAREALFFFREEIAQWSEESLKLMQRIGVLKQASPAKNMECPGCEESCVMPVHIISGVENGATRFFISCDKREDTGRISIDRESLLRWQIDVEGLVNGLASALDADQKPEEIVQKNIYYIGSITLNRKKRSIFFVRDHQNEDFGFKTSSLDQFPNPFFLVGTTTLEPKTQRHGEVISLRQVLLANDGGLTFDFGVLKDLLSKKGRVRQDVIPISVPLGTEWRHVFISFVNEHVVKIQVGKIIEHRSFDEMGFNDSRKNNNEPTDLWTVLKVMAEREGDIAWEDAQSVFKQPTKVKKYVSQIRAKLREVFPDIKGDPFFPYRRVKRYQPRFTLNTLPSFM